MMTDSVADMLTRIRNANRIEAPAVEMPATRVKAYIAQVLKDEGFIIDFQVGHYVAEGQGKVFHQTPDSKEPKRVLRIYLKYGPEGEKVIRHIERASRPGRRLYRRHTQLRPVLDGLGIAVLSTSRGVMSDRQARAQKLGGEVLCNVW
jgi:small subunit ribosomal protein S8